ncbi:electron transfer flavoprotein subunit alpha/FixB family protein [Desulforhopalus sp. IMCC35007]|uniref:electron transfer flavoprotein subunit alpha/FixB family protein n=1 Tax=Desulforhopalus sp. IMCC35007 TaxID=2569543 RepID=UPI0010AE5784|nr:electron transfer flavoprotein subunit alpha/FixB family protein [Desulforhopalus sp. IMCC35007]TKB10020.1 electron transfer flavoprotein subunit alpha/FixB family protein [Desulforhopalus sp. IMCC35007]
MKLLLIAESREGKLLGGSYELMAFAKVLGAETAMFLVGSEAALPKYDGKLYLADVAEAKEYNPDAHKALILDVVAKENPDCVVFCHSSYGWDLAPRLAFALKAAQISEVVGVDNGTMVVPVCNAKLRRDVKVGTEKTVITLQSGAFALTEEPTGSPAVEKITGATDAKIEFTGYEQAAAGGVDLGKAQVIVSAGRGIGKPENVAMVADLAKALGGEYGASRPVVDSEWVEHNRQVGTTGQTVAPKLYVACGISGAIQHLAGMKKSEFIVAINTDKDAPIGEVADVLVVSDLKQFVPILTEKIKSL